MQTVLALLVGVLFAGGLYLLLRRNLLKMIFGLVLLGNAVNLLVFSMGRVAAEAVPPLVAAGQTLPAEPFANPLPQALVLTAIVIGFGLVAFALVLVYRSYETLGTVAVAQLVEEAADPRAATQPAAGPQQATPAPLRSPRSAFSPPLTEEVRA